MDNNIIPKIIHQTYKDYDLPDIFSHCQKSIKELHPDFEYRFYTDNDMYNIITNEFPEYYDVFQKLPRMIMKIDMFRYFLMYKYGGLYTDMDYLMFKKFDLLNYEVVIPCNREKDNQPICLGNCIFASKPNHPFWKLLIDTLFDIDREKINYTNDINIDGNEYGTGPIFVYSMWKKYKEKLNNNNDIFIPKKDLFHPLTTLNNEYINTLKISGCYGMHICTGLWRNNKL